MKQCIYCKELWELDHVIPRNIFNYLSIKDKSFKTCWSLQNLRPILCINNKSRPKDGSDISEEIRKQILSGQNI